MGLQVTVECLLSVTAAEAVVGRQHVRGSGQCPLKGNQDKTEQSSILFSYSVAGFIGDRFCTNEVHTQKY